MKACALVEIFNSLPGKGGKEVENLLRVLESFGVDGAQGYRCVTHNDHLAWSQTDGSACGIFASLIILSLVRGLRIHAFNKMT